MDKKKKPNSVCFGLADVARFQHRDRSYRQVVCQMQRFLLSEPKYHTLKKLELDRVLRNVRGKKLEQGKIITRPNHYQLRSSQQASLSMLKETFLARLQLVLDKGGTSALTAFLEFPA